MEKDKVPAHASIDDIESGLQGLQSLGSTKALPSKKNKKLTIVRSGHAVPQTAIFDIKTRSFRNPIDMEEIYPVLWLRQIPNFILAYNKFGTFNDIRKQELSTETQKWEAVHLHDIQRLVGVIRMILEFAKKRAGTRLEIYRPPISGSDVLQIREQENGGVEILPSDLRTLWTLAMTGSGA